MEATQADQKKWATQTVSNKSEAERFTTVRTKQSGERRSRSLKLRRWLSESAETSCRCGKTEWKAGQPRLPVLNRGRKTTQTQGIQNNTGCILTLSSFGECIVKLKICFFKRTCFLYCSAHLLWWTFFWQPFFRGVDVCISIPQTLKQLIAALVFPVAPHSLVV